MIRNNKMLIDLHANKLSDFNELIEKLQRMENPQVRIIINLERKIIEINGKTDFEEDYFSELTCF